MYENGEKIQIYDKYVWGTFIFQAQNTLKIKQTNSLNLQVHYTIPYHNVNAMG
jgi:hypothetical protein